MDNVTSIQSSHIFIDHNTSIDQALRMDLRLLQLPRLHPDQGGLQVIPGPPLAVLAVQGGLSQHPKVLLLLLVLPIPSLQRL